jgi:uncharacterized membrane protein YdjX (TVP38/TMEM64 family)
MVSAAPPSTASRRRLLPLGALLLAGGLFLAFGGRHYLSIAALAENHAWLADRVGQAGAAAPLVFIAAYAGLVALSVPGAALLTVAGGLLFGAWLGTAYAVIGATLGATAVFVAARAGLTGLVARAGPRLRRFEDGFRANALSYLLVLRLIPIFPFWLVNLAAGALGLKLPVFIVGTFVGIIPVTFIYASLGSGLGTLAAEGAGLNPAILARPGITLPLLGLAVLALLPVGWKRWRGRRDGPAP